MMINVNNLIDTQYTKFKTLISQLRTLYISNSKSKALSPTGYDFLQYLQVNRCIVLDCPPEEDMHFFPGKQSEESCAKADIIAFDIDALERQLTLEQDILLDTTLNEIDLDTSCIASNITLGFIDKPKQALSNDELEKILEQTLNDLDLLTLSNNESEKVLETRLA